MWSEHKRREPLEATRLRFRYSGRDVRTSQVSGRHTRLAWTGSGAVDLDHLSVRPLDRIGRRHPLDRLRVHVYNDVLGLHLGGFLVGWSGIACQPSRDWNLLEGCEDRIDAPHVMISQILVGPVV